jgi:hypothetical protein
MSEASETVRVVVRSRPFSKKEVADGRKPIVAVDSASQSVALTNPGSEGGKDVKGFTFDAVYGEDSTQRAVYDETAYPLVESVLKGYNGTIFAYGCAAGARGSAAAARARASAPLSHSHPATRTRPTTGRPQPDGLRQDAHHAGLPRPPRAARHYPQLL